MGEVIIIELLSTIIDFFIDNRVYFLFLIFTILLWKLIPTYPKFRIIPFGFATTIFNHFTNQIGMKFQKIFYPVGYYSFKIQGYLLYILFGNIKKSIISGICIFFLLIFYRDYWIFQDITIEIKLVVIILFISIVLHEFTHAFIAESLNVKIKEIVFLFLPFNINVAGLVIPNEHFDQNTSDLRTDDEGQIIPFNSEELTKKKDMLLHSGMISSGGLSITLSIMFFSIILVNIMTGKIQYLFLNFAKINLILFIFNFVPFPNSDGNKVLKIIKTLNILERSQSINPFI